jgi:polygalacturonase
MDQSKRNFIKRVGLLGATGGMAAVLSSANGQQVTAGAQNSSVFNVKDFGATGDGQTPDSAAIQKALDEAGKVQGTAYFPSGRYRCHDLKVLPYTTVLAEPQWAYSPDAGAVLTIDSEDADCVLDISEAYGCHIRGIFLRGNRREQRIQHGIFQNHATEFTSRENSPVIDEVSVNQFSGHGVYLLRIWLFIIRHSIFKSNAGHGVCILGWDGFVTDNQFSGNGKSGFATEPGGGSTVMFTANRVEWNGEYGLNLAGGDCWNVTGNAFDRNYGAAISANRVSNSTFTGNVFRRNGKEASKVMEGLDESCQMLIQSCRGITVTGNSGAVGRDDGGRGVYTPNYAFWLRDNTCSIITANAFSRGYLKEMILDKGGNREDVLINNNIGSVFEIPNP